MQRVEPLDSMVVELLPIFKSRRRDIENGDDGH
jgi:hypothetical protein